MIDLGVSHNYLYAARQVTTEIGMPDGSIKSLSGSGSGFIVRHGSSESSKFYFVTNRHVVDPSYAGRERVGQTLVGITVRGFDTTETGEEIAWGFKVESPKIQFGSGRDDLAVIPLPSTEFVEHSGGHLSNYYWSELLVESGDFGSPDRSRSILAMDVLAVCGYPEIGGEIQKRPVALVGFIASDPAHAPDPAPRLIEGMRMQSRSVVLYQGFSRPGMSGSPVLAVRRGYQLAGGLRGPPSRQLRLVGINAGRIELAQDQTSALSYFIRSDAILRAIEAAHEN